MDDGSRLQTRQRDRTWIVVLVVWLATVTVGMLVLADYSARPGVAARAPLRWPAASRVERDRRLPTLVMLLHPLCPCSRASIGELAGLMATLKNKIVADVLVLDPEGADDQWQTSDLRTAAAAIPGVRMFDDVDGEQARLFGGSTSGQTFLYDRDGQLRFAGGITGARGHEGGNFGIDAVVAAVLTPGGEVATTPVFGCALVPAPPAVDVTGQSS